ncbi:unnamed protein product [Blumeria hordei]|uniref:Uncharacterized protein n=1 Tax=Blumeria hordei TaxID=2867405 RepID=A0A383UPC6_BLUHO|nr:unnamed protein product [Blumeria hordei]
MSPPNSRPPLTSRIRASFEGRRHKAEVSSPTSPNSYDNKSIRTIVEQVINTQPFQTAVATNLAQLIKPNIKDALDTIQPLVEAVYAHEVLLRKTNFSVENLLTKLETDVLRPKSNSTSIVESDNEEIVLPQILHISKSHSKASGNNSSSINLDKKSFGKTVNANKDAVTDSIEGAQYSTLAAETFVQEIMPIKQQIKDLELNTEHSKCNMGLMEEKLDQIKSDLSIVISMISEEKGGGTTASLDSSKGSRTSLEDHNYAGNRYRDGLSRSSTQGSDSTITMKKKYIKEPKQKFCKDKSHDSNASQEPSVVETRSRSPSDSLHTQTLKKLELEVANLKESFDSKMASNDERISTVLATLENHPQTPSDNYFVKAIEKLNTNQESQYLALCTLLTEGMTLTRNKEFEKLGLKVAQLQDHLKGPDVILEDIRSSNALQKNALVNQTSVLDEIKINMASYDTKLQQHSEAITRLISISSEPLPIVTADKSGLEEHITSLNDTLKSHTSEFVEIKAANAAHAKVLEKNTANLEQIKADIESYMATVQNNIGLFDETTRDTLASTQLTYNNSIALGDQIMSIKANVDSQKSCLDKFKFETEFNYNKKFDLVESQIKDITDSLISHSSFLDQILSKCSAYNTALQTVNDMEEFFKSELHEIKQSNDMNSRTLSSIKSNYENKIDVINQVNAWGVSFNQDMKDIKSLQESYARTSSDNQQKNLDILKRIKDSHELHSDVLSGIKEAIDSSTSDSKIIKAFHKSHEGTILDIKTSIDVTNTNFGVKLGSIESTVFENDKKLELLKRTVQNMKQDITLDFESEKIYKILQMIVESLAAHSVLLGEIKEDVCAEILTSLHDLERVIQSNSNLLADTQHVDVNAEILTLLHTINEDYSSIPLSLSEIKDHCANPNPSSVVIALIQKRFADIEGAMSEHLNHLITLSSFADSSKKREDIKLSKLKEVESFIEQILGTSKESTFKINEIILKLDCQNTAIDRLNQKSYNETSLKILNTLQSTNELSLIKIEENSFNARNINDETRNLYKLIEKIHTFIISAFPEIKSGQEHLENLGEKSRQEAKSELSQISEYLLTLQTILGKASNTIDNTFSEVIKPYHDQDITHHMSVISDSMKNDIQKFGTVVQDFMEKVEENKILLNSMTETLRDIISISLTDNGDGYAPNQGRRQTHQDTSLREEIGFSAETEAFLSQSDSIDSYQVKKKEIIKRNVFSGLNPSSTVNDWQKEALKFPDERKLATICSGDIGNHVLQTDFQIESNFPAQSDLQVESMTQVNENNDFIRKIDSQSQGNNVGHKLTPECIVKDEDCPLKTDLPSQSGDQNKYHLPVEFKERTARNAENANQIQQNIVKPIPDTTRLKFQSECKDETEESNKYLDLPAKAVTPSIDIGHNIQKNDVITNDNFVTAKVTSECQANSDQHIKRSSRGQESAVPGETHFQITSETIETSDLHNEINASPTDIKDIILNHNFVQHVDKFLLHEPTQCQDNTVEFVENSNPPDIPKLACESNYPIELDTIRELDLPHKISEPIHEVRHVGHNADLIQDHNVECFDEATQFEENSSDFQLKTRLRLKSVIPVICDAIVQSNITTETGVTTINANSIASSDDLIQKYDTVRLDKTQECKHNNADNIEKSIVQKEFDASHDSFNLNEAKVNLKPDLSTEVVPSTINNGEIICSEDMVPDNAEIDLYKTTGYIHEPQNSINKTKPKAEAAASNESMYPDEHNIILKLDDPSTANASAIDVYKIGIREDIIQDNNDVRLSGALECQNSALQDVEETILPLSSNILNKSTLSDEDDIIRQSDLPVENVQSTIDVEDSIRADDVGDSNEAIVLNCDPIDSIEKSSALVEPDDFDGSVHLNEVDISHESDLPVENVQSTIDVEDSNCSDDMNRNHDVEHSDKVSECNDDPSESIKESSARDEHVAFDESVHLNEVDISHESDLPVENVQSTIDVEDSNCSDDMNRNHDVEHSDHASECNDDPSESIKESSALVEPDEFDGSVHLNEVDISHESDLPVENVQSTIDVEDSNCSDDMNRNHDVEHSDHASECNDDPAESIKESSARDEHVAFDESVHLDEVDISRESDLPSEIAVTTIDVEDSNCSDDMNRNHDVEHSDHASECNDDPAESIKESSARDEHVAFDESVHLDEVDISRESDLPSEIAVTTIDVEDSNCSDDMNRNHDVEHSDHASECNDDPAESIKESSARDEHVAFDESVHLNEVDISHESDLPVENVQSTIDVEDSNCSDDMNRNHDVEHSDKVSECNDDPAESIKESSARDEHVAFDESVHLDEVDISRESDLPSEIAVKTIDVEESNSSDDWSRNHDVAHSDNASECDDDPADSIGKSSCAEEPVALDESVHLDEVDISHESDTPIEIAVTTGDVEESNSSDDVGDSIEAFVLNIDPIDSIEELSGRDEPDSVDESVHLDEVDISRESDLPSEIAVTTIDVEDSNCSDDMNRNHDVEHSDHASECNDDPAESIKESSARDEHVAFDESVHLDEVDLSHESDLPVENVQSTIDVEDSIRADDIGDSIEAIVLNFDPIESHEESSAREEPDSVDESVQLDEVDLSHESDLPVENVQSTIDVEDSNCSDDMNRNHDVEHSDHASECNDDPAESIKESSARDEHVAFDESVHLDEVDISRESALPSEIAVTTIDVEESNSSDDWSRNHDVAHSDNASECDDDPADSIGKSSCAEEPVALDESVHLDEVDISHESDYPLENVQSTIDVDDSIRADDVGDSIEAIMLNCDPIESIEESLSREEHVAFDESVHLDEVDISHESDTPIEIAVTTGDVEESNSSDDVGDSIEAFVLNIDPIDSIEELSGRDEPDSVDESVHLDEVDISHESDFPLENVQSSIDVEDSIRADDVGDSNEAIVLNCDPIDSIEKSSGREEPDAFNGSVHLDEVDISREPDLPIEIVQSTLDVEERICSDDVARAYEAIILNFDPINSIAESSAKAVSDLIDESEYLNRGDRFEVDAQEMMLKDNPGDDDKIADVSEACVCQDGALKAVEEMNPVFKPENLRETAFPAREDDFCDLDFLKNDIARTHGVESVNSSDNIIDHTAEAPLDKTRQGLDDLADSIREPMLRDESDELYEILNSNKVNVYLEADMPTEIITSTNDADVTLCSYGICQHDDVARKDELRDCEDEVLDIMGESHLHVQSNNLCESELLGENNPDCELLLPAEINGLVFDVDEIVGGDDLTLRVEVIRSDDPTESRYLSADCIEVTKVLDETDVSDEPLHHGKPDVNRETDLPTENIASITDVDDIFCNDENIQHDEVGSDVALESKDDSEKLNNDVGCSAERDDAMLLVTSVVSMISKPGNEDISVGNKLLGTDDDGSPKVLNKCESDSVNLNPAEILSKHVVPNIEFNRSNMGNDEFSGDIEDLFEDLLSSKDEVMDCIKGTDMPAGSLEYISDNVDNIQGNIIGELDDNDEAKKPFESNVVIAHITKVTDFPVESVELSHDNEKILLKNFHRTEVENAETILGKKSLVHAETISDEKIVHTSDVMDADTKTKCLPDVSKTGFSMHKDSIEEIESSIRNSGNVDIAEGLVIDAVAIDSVDCSFDGNGNTENSVTKRHYILSPENQALVGFISHERLIGTDKIKENLVPEKMSLGMEILPEDFDVDYEHPPDQTMDPSVKITKSTEIDRKTDSIHAESQIFDRKEIKKSMLVEEISAEVGKYDCDEIANTDEGCLKGDTKLKWFDTDFSDVKFAETMKMPSQEQTSMENSVATNCTEVDKESELMSKKEISTEAPNQKIDASKAMEINEVIVFKKLPSEIDNILEGAKKAEMKTSMDSVVIPKQSETSVDEVEFDVIEVPRKEILGDDLVLESELEANSPQNKIVGKLDIDEKLFSQVQTDKKVLDESHTIDIPREKLNLDEIPENITEDKKSIFGNWEGLEITKSRNHEAEDSCVETFLKSENEDDSSCLDYKILMIPRKRSEKFEELIRKFEGESEDQ